MAKDIWWRAGESRGTGAERHEGRDGGRRQKLNAATWRQTNSDRSGTSGRIVSLSGSLTEPVSHRSQYQPSRDSVQWNFFFPWTNVNFFFHCREQLCYYNTDTKLNTTAQKAAVAMDDAMFVISDKERLENFVNHSTTYIWVVFVLRCIILWELL